MGMVAVPLPPPTVRYTVTLGSRPSLSSGVIGEPTASSVEPSSGSECPPAGAPVFPSTAECMRTHLTFTGTGAEYFRIWIVQVLLGVLSLGVYSAWAKVRKARWFAQHTQLLGDAFDYHGQPKRILLGRAVAIVLFIAYSRSFEWSRTLGLAVVAVLLLLGPILVNSAQRFRMANTSWRGVRFGFDATPWKVYAVCVPVLLLWTAGTLWTALRGSAAGVAWVTLCSALCWPAAHASFKRLQHQQARYGDQSFEFRPVTRAFYGVYGKAFGLALGTVFVIGIPVGMLGAAVNASHAAPSPTISLVIGAGTVGVIYLIVWPFVTASLQRIVWSHTSCNGVRFFSDISAGRLCGLVVRQMLLVVLTAGLYWPFAAVAFARYRVESVGLESGSELPEIVARVNQRVGTVGDAAFDIFGFDLGW